MGGYEFAHASCRFRVVACEPNGPCVVGPDTEVFWEGKPLERLILKQIAVLPFAHTLPPAASGAPKPDLFELYVKHYFEQKSAPLNPGDEFDARGVRFRVVKVNPPGGGPHKDTQVFSEGPALVVCTVANCGGVATQRCTEPGCGKVICTKHATKVDSPSASAASGSSGSKVLC